MAAKNSANKKKNATENIRKKSIQQNHHASFLMMPKAKLLLAKGKKVDLLEQSKTVKDGLSKIPNVFLKHFTVGTSQEDCPLLRQEVEKIKRWCDEVEELEQQQGTNQSLALPELAVNIWLPVSDDDEILISKISDSTESKFQGLTQEDVVGQTLSNLIKSKDYIALHKHLMKLKKTMNPETSRNLEPHKCRVDPRWWVRAGINPNESDVLLRGVIRLLSGQNGTLPAESSAVERSIPPANQQALAAYSSSCPSPSSMPISWPKQCQTFLHSKITSYVTIHSVSDMSILWVDERITHVNLWGPDDVFGQSPYLHMDPQDRSHAEAVRDATLLMGQNGMVSYAFITKRRDIIYQRSQSCGKIVTLYPTTNQPIQGFQVFTAEMSEAEYLDGMRAEKELLSGQSPPCITEESYSNPEASRVNEQSVAGCGDVIDGYRNINFHPEDSHGSSIHPTLDEMNSISDVQCYDNQPPLPSVCDSPISQSMQMESPYISFSNSKSPRYHELNSTVSEMQCYDNQPQFAPISSVCDSPISQWMEMDSSDSNFGYIQSPSQYQELNSIVSEVQSYDNQLQIAPLSAVCDSPITQRMEMNSPDSSFGNSQSPSQYQEPNSIVSEVQWYDNQPPIDPLSAVPISQWMEMNSPDSSLGSSESPSLQELSFGTEYSFNCASPDTYMSP